MTERPATQAMIDSGLIDSANIAQLKKWGLLSGEGEPIEVLSSPNAIVDRIRAVLESAVEMRDTDLDVIKLYIQKREKGKLHLPPETGTKTVPISIEYCKTKMGEYVIPWTSEDISDLLLDPRTYLKTADKKHIRFVDIRELYYDDVKSFIVCAPRSKVA